MLLVYENKNFMRKDTYGQSVIAGDRPDQINRVHNQLAGFTGHPDDDVQAKRDPARRNNIGEFRNHGSYSVCIFFGFGNK